MTTHFNETRGYSSVIEGPQARRELAKGSLVGRRQARRDRRANRAF